MGIHVSPRVIPCCCSCEDCGYDAVFSISIGCTRVELCRHHTFKLHKQLGAV